MRIDVRLDIEQAYTEIEVTAGMIDALLPASSNVVSDRVFNDLPINGRRFHDFALLTPGVQISRAAGHLSFGAQRGIYTNVSVDGTDYNQAFFGGDTGRRAGRSGDDAPPERDPRVPSGDLRLHRRVRPHDFRSRQRVHEVGRQRTARGCVLPKCAIRAWAWPTRSGPRCLRT